MAVTGTLDAESRRQAQLEILATAGQLQLSEAIRLWDVHPMTIRRDFDQLESSGHGRRVRGGIVSISASGFQQRQHMNLSAKRRIAEKVRPLVQPGATIGLDSSTTGFALAARLNQDAADLTVVTNGLETFEVLGGNARVRTYLTGGEREKQNRSLVGQLAVSAFLSFNLDCAIMSALGIHPETGTSETTLEQSATKKAMAQAAHQVILAVDSSKLDARSAARSLTLDAIDVLVTELRPADRRLDPYRDVIAQIV